MMMSLSWRRTLAAAALVGLALFVASASSMSIEQANSKEEEIAVALPARHRFTVAPSQLARFLFYNTKPFERMGAFAGGMLDNKRSSSALDMVSGMVVGKRSLGAGSSSPAALEFVNWEPFYGRQQYGLPRMYDLRWAPLDAYEPASSSSGSD